MFDKTIIDLQQMQSVSIPIDTDEKGYIDRQCPSEECEFFFKVKKDGWEDICTDEAIWCPLCGHTADSKSWFTYEQINEGQEKAIEHIQSVLHNGFIEGAKAFNRKHRSDSLFSINMKVKGIKRDTKIIPISSVESMQLEIKCEKCDLEYAVVGSAYFCPACGHNSVVNTFFDSLRKIKAKTDNLLLIKESLLENNQADDAELITRSLKETFLSDGVVAFQKYSEGLYKDYGKVPFNAFQRISDSSELWKKVIGKEYKDILTVDELSQLNKIYQKRHLLQHNEGIVDKKYIEKTNDYTYKEGQRIVINEKDIDTFLKILEKLAQEIKHLINA